MALSVYQLACRIGGFNSRGDTQARDEKYLALSARGRAPRSCIARYALCPAR